MSIEENFRRGTRDIEKGELPSTEGLKTQPDVFGLESPRSSRKGAGSGWEKEGLALFLPSLELAWSVKHRDWSQREGPSGGHWDCSESVCDEEGEIRGREGGKSTGAGNGSPVIREVRRGQMKKKGGGKISYRQNRLIPNLNGRQSIKRLLEPEIGSEASRNPYPPGKKGYGGPSRVPGEEEKKIKISTSFQCRRRDGVMTEKIEKKRLHTSWASGRSMVWRFAVTDTRHPRSEQPLKFKSFEKWEA